jgi:hypothetical protein
MDLASSDEIGEEWSSQVTRCQSKMADTIKSYKYLSFELEILIEEEHRCAVACCCERLSDFLTFLGVCRPLQWEAFQRVQRMIAEYGECWLVL